MQKNVASQKLAVYAFDSTTNLPKTGDAANLTAYVDKDWAGLNVLTDTSATEVDATNAKGYYIFDLAQAETNADTLLFSCKSSTSNIVVLAVPPVVFTTAPNFNLTSINGSGQLDVIKLAGQTVTAAAGVTFPSNLASPTNITAGTITTTTNLTNAPTSGDFTATMKTSIGTAVAASAVASVTGNVGGSVATLTAVSAGAITAASFATGAIDAAAIATDAIGSAELAASAVTKIATGVGVLACTEPTAVIAASPTLIAAISWLATLSRNKITQTATTQTLRADDGSTGIAASTLSDDGTTFSRGEFA